VWQTRVGILLADYWSRKQKTRTEGSWAVAEIAILDIVAAFADSLDSASVEKLKAIAQRIDAARQAREKQ